MVYIGFFMDMEIKKQGFEGPAWGAPILFQWSLAEGLRFFLGGSMMTRLL